MRISEEELAEYLNKHALMDKTTAACVAFQIAEDYYFEHGED